MAPPRSSADLPPITLGPFHAGQMAAFRALNRHRFMALRCGRRVGKTEYAKTWIIQGLLQGESCAWFAPQHMLASEVHHELTRQLWPLLNTSSKSAGVIRLINDGRLDFWSLETLTAGRSRGYQRVVIDEAAFA